MATPSTVGAPDPPQLTLPEQGPGSAAWWRGQLDWRDEIVKEKLKEWRYHADAYRSAVKPPREEGVRVNIEFEKTEQKKHQLFFRLPELKLRPSPRTQRDASAAPAPGMEPRDLRKAIAIYREVLKRLVGPHGANTKAAMTEILFDALCPAGLGFVKVGYERYTDGVVPMQTGERPIPGGMPGSVLGLGPVPMEPVYTNAPNVISERYYATRISPPNGIIPAEFRLSDYNQADFLGHRFYGTRADAERRKWRIPDGATESAPSGEEDDRIVKLARSGERPGQFRFTELFYYGARLNGSAAHPDRIHRIVFVDGATDPVLHTPFKDQRFDARGRFTGGLRTLPIKVLALRYVSDDPYPPSDCQITRSLSDELSEFRTQTIVHRRKSVPMIGVDINAIVNEDIKARILERKYCDTIPFNGPPDKSIVEIARGSYPTENRIAADMIMADANRLWALGANSGAVTEKGSTTATEIQAIAQATANRLGGEREIVIGYWLQLVEALGSLCQLYADREDYVEIVGEDGAAQIEAFTKDTIQGEYLYEIVPDSSLPPDGAADRDGALNFHNLTANSPYINGEQEARDLVEAYGRDPDRLVTTPAPPPPEKPKISISINGKDLDPTSPQYPNVVGMLIASGVPKDQISAVQQASAAAPVPAEPQKPAPVVDRERLRMAEADNHDRRAGGLVTQ